MTINNEVSLAERILNVTDPGDRPTALSDAHHALTGERMSATDLLAEAEALRQATWVKDTERYIHLM